MAKMKDYFVSLGTPVEIELSQFTIKPSGKQDLFVAHNLITKNSELKFYEEFSIHIPQHIIAGGFSIEDYMKDLLIIERIKFPGLFVGKVIFISINNSTGGQIPVESVHKLRSSCRFLLKLDLGGYASIAQHLTNKL
jgi:hypothetical protein